LVGTESLLPREPNFHEYNIPTSQHSETHFDFFWRENTPSDLSRVRR